MKINKLKLCLRTNTFEEGWNSLKQYILEIGELFPNHNTRNEVQIEMINLISKHNPDIDNNKNILWSLTIQPNRCLLKTNKLISFGWSVDYSVKTSTLNSYEFMIELHPKLKYQYKLLKNAGWSDKPIKEEIHEVSEKENI